MCGYLIGLDVATASGEIKHCDEYENSDLFWAARGCGPGESALKEMCAHELTPEMVFRLSRSHTEVLLQDSTGTQGLQKKHIRLSHQSL